MRGWRTHRRLLPALLGALALGLLTAAPAGAYLRDFQTVGLSSVINSTTVKSVSVPCPPGKLPLGAGGAVISPFGNLGLDNLWVFFGQGRTLNGGSETDSVGARWLVTGRSFCAAQTPTIPPGGGAPFIKNVSWKNRTSPANSTAFKSVVATCPAGASAIGGGGELTGATNDLAFDSVRRAGAAGFRVRAHEVDPTGVGWSVTATAICANITTVPPGAQYVGATPITGPDTGPGPLHTGTAATTASCPGGKSIIGGGAFLTGVAPGSPPPADVVLTASRPISSTTWLGRARDTDPPNQAYHLQVRAVCG
jgi:hypothetical protein